MTEMDYATLAGTYIKQGAFFGCSVWLVVYCINRGWLFFKGITH